MKSLQVSSLPFHAYCLFCKIKLACCDFGGDRQGVPWFTKRTQLELLGELSSLLISSLSTQKFWVLAWSFFFQRMRIIHALTNFYFWSQTASVFMLKYIPLFCFVFEYIVITSDFIIFLHIPWTFWHVDLNTRYFKHHNMLYKVCMYFSFYIMSI